ncbi:MAG: hypothetical protein HOQ46_04475 [Saccharothrix sp.]|nr:hypothetical protein [Saccharothrix sp.]
MAARGEAQQADVEVSTLVVPAWRLRWRAPELALVLGERAVALASTRRDEVDRLRAEALVVFASNRMGRGVRIADRALDALKAAEAASERETAWRLRVELADSARSVGAPLTGFAAVRPVLEADDVPPGLRATALVQASECLVSVGRGAALAQALDEADHLYQADPLLDHDTTLLHRGLLRASAAGQHRRWGDLQAAVAAARDGLAVLDRLKEADSDNGQVRGRLTVELVCALMDLNKLGEASEIGTPLLELPVRAPSASTTGWLRLALATRVHLPAGRVDQARDLLRDAADSAERHQLDTLLAESLLALAHVHEVAGDLAEALANLRSAHAAERRRARAVYAVRARLAAEFAGVHRQPAGGLHDELAALLRTGTPAVAPPTDPNLAPEVKQQLRQWRPVQMHRNEGVRVKRSRRAAEDMTVDGLSAARAHAADRWRLVQPFGETEGDPQPGGRRRAPEPESRPTQGRPEHARSGQARPTTPPSATPAAHQAAAHATNAPADTHQPSGAHAGGAAANHPGGTTSSGTAPAGGHSGDGPTEVASGAAGLGVTRAGSHTGGGSEEAAVSGFGSVAAGGQPGGGSDDAAVSGFGSVAAGGQSGSGSDDAAVSGFGSAAAGGQSSSGPDEAAVVGFGGTPIGGHAGGGRDENAVTGLGGGSGSEDAGRPAVGAGPAGGAEPGSSAGAERWPAASDGAQGDGVDSGGVAAGEGAVGSQGVGGQGVRRPMGGAGFGGGGFGIVQRDVEASGGGEAPAAGTEGGERSVPAAGLIAAAGAVRSGRRRAAREAADDERATGDSDSNVLDTLKAAGLLDPQRAGGRRRAPDADAGAGPGVDEGASAPEPVRQPAVEAEPVRQVTAETVQQAAQQAAHESEPVRQAATEPEPVQWRVEPPPRLRSEVPPPPVDMFDSPTMVQPAIRDDVPPVGLGAAFVKGPLIPTARVPDPPDFPLPPVPDFGISAVGKDLPERATSVAGPQTTDDVEVRPVFPSTDVDAAAPQSPQPQPPLQPAQVPLQPVQPQPEPDQVPGVPEPDQVPPVPVPEPVPSEPSPESALLDTPLLDTPLLDTPLPETAQPENAEPETTEPGSTQPDPAQPEAVEPEPAQAPAQFGPTGFLSAADVEHDDTPTTGHEPEPVVGEVPKEPFVTAVVVGGKTIDLPAIVEPTPPVSDSPSATRASRRHKSDLSLAELLAEALVAYEDARREDEAAGRTEVDEDTVPISPVGNPTPPSDNETTAPIQRVDAPRRFDTWTLPES